MLPSWSPGPSDISISPHTQGSARFCGSADLQASICSASELFSVMVRRGNASVDLVG